jgi:hypothetical protein
MDPSRTVSTKPGANHSHKPDAASAVAVRLESECCRVPDPLGFTEIAGEILLPNPLVDVSRFEERLRRKPWREKRPHIAIGSAETNTGE